MPSRCGCGAGNAGWGAECHDEVCWTYESSVFFRDSVDEVQVCWMWQSYIPRTGSLSAVIQRLGDFWKTFKEKAGQFRIVCKYDVE